MVVVSPDATIIIIVVAVVVVIIVVICVVCCLCRKCEQCARWSRRKAYTREEARHESERAVRREEYDQAQIERDAYRDGIRAKYNLPTGKANIATIS